MLGRAQVCHVWTVAAGDSQLNGAPPPIPPLKPSAPEEADLKAEAERLAMYKCIIANIVESETIYVESLSLLLQYMKALRSTIDTSQPLLSKDDFQLIFFKIPELQALHDTFLKGLRAKSESWNSHTLIGDDFKVLASRLGVYAAFLQNYSRAIETVRRCSTSNSKFQEITKTIKLKSQQGQATNLEDLLHKPVARVQKNALVLHDLLRYTPASHPDAKTLKTALKMTQCFLNDLNLAAAAESMFPAMDKAQRHLVKNSFIVELSDGHRKLRHLFLFNDVIVCAKCKPSNRQKFTFEIKWYIPLAEVVLPPGEAEVKEVSPQDVLSLKSRASTFRDHILKEESNQKTNNRSVDKHKKKLSELEGQLVLASPMLPFRVGHKSRTYTFFLSSEFERAQWVEAISILQLSAPAATAPLSSYELQAWISSCRKHLGSSLGSFLFRTGKDEDLLVGDLAITVYSLHGMTRPADVYLCFEVDSYGHFFNKATTKVSHNTTEAQFNQDFVLELEGSQSLRILLYECTARNPILRGKAALELTGGWLSVRMQEKSVALQDFMLSLGLKFQPGTASLGPPSGGRGTLFGIKIQQVCKKEKSAVPFLIRLCVREVERRGMTEVGIYRVSGSTADVAKLRKAFETNLYTGEQLLKETDIHTVTGLLKMFLRELPEPLFTDLLHAKFLSAFNTNSGRGEEQQEEKQRQLVTLFNSLPQVNQNVINFLLDHMLRVHRAEAKNKMSLHNLATVFGPTMLRQPENSGQPSSSSDLLTAGTVDVMAQAGILYFFLCRRQRTAQL
ncbi:ABR [Cordylochernes scorpioides]|uniref:ABR n=1 Tax=Cordylochernes scorpioides TaxID=51811 RepID=A0ABY6LCR8_9ARAC|nr:ABR [Cordylochernes scorpioides]